jgi:glutamate-1-semialdehyde 2,1-aminomutase
MASAKGAYLFDADGNAYVDFINSWGPMILGHAHPAIEAAAIEAIKGSPSFGAPGEREVRMAETIVRMVPSAEKVRMVNSGTEATMSAIRLARGYTGRSKILKFEGCYHGHGDSFLIAAGSGAMTFGVPDSAGVTEGVAKDTLTAAYNDLAGVDALVKANAGEIAAIIVEPVAGNMGLVAPAPGFLEGLRSICDREGILLVFDEVMTGFRLAPGGAQELLGVMPDLTTLGKIIGGGMPVGAYCGRGEIMDYISPSGPIYQAGTLSGNPVAMAAGLAMLEILEGNDALYRQLDQTGQEIQDGISALLRSAGIPAQVNRVGSMLTVFFTDEAVTDLKTAKTSDTAKFASFFRHLLNQGVYLPPSQFEAWFVSAAIGDREKELLFKATKSFSTI